MGVICTGFLLGIGIAPGMVVGAGLSSGALILTNQIAYGSTKAVLKTYDFARRGFSAMRHRLSRKQPVAA